MWDLAAAVVRSALSWGTKSSQASRVVRQYFPFSFSPTRGATPNHLIPGFGWCSCDLLRRRSAWLSCFYGGGGLPGFSGSVLASCRFSRFKIIETEINTTINHPKLFPKRFQVRYDSCTYHAPVIHAFPNLSSMMHVPCSSI